MSPLSFECRELLRTLTRKVRLLSLPQAARTWWSQFDQPQAVAQVNLQTLIDAGLLEPLPCFVHPELDLNSPVFCWSPERHEEPDFGPIAYRLQSRWDRPPEMLPTVFATRKANIQLGGDVGGRAPRAGERRHDLHVASVYLKLYCSPDREQQRRAQRWVAEDTLYAQGQGRNQKLPDAVIRHKRDRRRDVVIEFGGSYSKQKLQQVHAATRHLAYEIW